MIRIILCLPRLFGIWLNDIFDFELFWDVNKKQISKSTNCNYFGFLALVEAYKNEHQLYEQECVTPLPHSFGDSSGKNDLWLSAEDLRKLLQSIPEF